MHSLCLNVTRNHRLFQHLEEAGDKYSAPDELDNRSASSSPDGTSAEAVGSEDGEASAMQQDEQPQPRSAIC